MKGIGKLLYSVNAYFALILYYLQKQKKEQIWIIGGHNGRLYADNAKVFYEYILEKHPHIKIYWVANKDAPCRQQIKGHYLIKGSINAYLQFYRSEVTLFSDTFNSDIAPLAFILPLVKRYYNRSFKVYLNHGTISFKKMVLYKGIVGKIKQRIFESYNLATAATQLEKKAMSRYLRESIVEITGSARNDILKTKSSERNIILITPTWRIWLANNISLKDTDFFHYYYHLLTNKKLNDYLEKNNLTIHFYLHHMMQKFLHEFEECSNKNIIILSPETNMNLEIQQAQILITDYSSICADFYYLNKPVLFFQFDRDIYQQNIGSEINLKKDIFGEVSLSINDLVKVLIHRIEQGNISSKQKAGEHFFIHFQDTDNCNRIYHTILKKYSDQTP